MAPVGQAETHHGFSQWKQGMKINDVFGSPPMNFGPTWMIWQGLGPIGRFLLDLHWISQAWHPIHFLISWNR